MNYDPTAREKLHAIGQKQGPCAFCGAPYARHRLWDTVDGCILRGESTRQICREFPYVTPREVRLVREAYAEARRRHEALPGRANHGGANG